MRHQLAESIHKQYRTMYEKGMVNETDQLESEYDLLKAKTEPDAERGTVRISCAASTCSSVHGYQYRL